MNKKESIKANSLKNIENTSSSLVSDCETSNLNMLNPRSQTVELGLASISSSELTVRDIQSADSPKSYDENSEGDDIDFDYEDLMDMDFVTKCLNSASLE